MVEPSVGTEDQDQGVAVKSNAGKTLVVGGKGVSRTWTF